MSEPAAESTAAEPETQDDPRFAELGERVEGLAQAMEQLASAQGERRAELEQDVAEQQRALQEFFERGGTLEDLRSLADEREYERFRSLAERYGDELAAEAEAAGFAGAPGGDGGETGQTPASEQGGAPAGKPPPAEQPPDEPPGPEPPRRSEPEFRAFP